MAVDPEFQRLLGAETAADAARLHAWAHEAQRSRGVAWSGLDPGPAPAPDRAARTESAARRLADLRRWRETAPARLLAAMADAERAVETLRACAARGLAAHDARCGVALKALEQAAAAARAAMDASAASGQSGGPCAMNSASRPTSTTWPKSSAS